MKVSRSSGGGAWLDKKTLRNGDLLKIVSEATEIESQQGGTQLVAHVRVKGVDGEFNCAINSPSKNALIEAFGDNTEDWIDKVLTINVEKTVVAGKRGIALYLIPQGYEVTEDGSGYVIITPIGAPKAQPSETSEYPQEDISPDDIPF